MRTSDACNSSSGGSCLLTACLIGEGDLRNVFRLYLACCSLQVKFVTPEVAPAGWAHRSVPERVAAGDQFSGCLKAVFSLWPIHE